MGNVRTRSFKQKNVHELRDALEYLIGPQSGSVWSTGGVCSLLAPRDARTLLRWHHGRSAFPLGECVPDDRVGVSVAESVFGLELRNEFHVPFQRGRADKLDPLFDRAAVLLLDRRETWIFSWRPRVAACSTGCCSAVSPASWHATPRVRSSLPGPPSSKEPVTRASRQPKPRVDVSSRLARRESLLIPPDRADGGGVRERRGTPGRHALHGEVFSGHTVVRPAGGAAELRGA